MMDIELVIVKKVNVQNQSVFLLKKESLAYTLQKHNSKDKGH